MLTEEKINQNYLTFLKKLETYGCYSEEMMNEIGDKVKYGTYSMQDEYGGCYAGSLIEITLQTLCRIGYEINENAFGKNGKETFSHPYLAVNTNKLMRVLLLLNLAKAEMFIDETEQWKLKKGIMYKFQDFETALKLGARTLYLCQKYGIKLEEDEFEAILAIDDAEDNGARFRTPLYTLVKAVKLFTLVELRRKWEANHKNNVETMEK